MKKKMIIVLSVVMIAICIGRLYQTFAISSSVTLSDGEYDINLTESTSTVSVSAGSTKTVMYQISNTNKGVIQYGVGYSSDNTNIKVKEFYDTIDPAIGTFDYGENKFVKLKLYNKSSEDAEITLTAVLGYEYGGDLIPGDGVTLVTEKIAEYPLLMSVGTQSATSLFLSSESTVTREQIDSINFVNTNVVPDGMTGFDVSKNQDESIMYWYGEANNAGLYDVYIGSESGKIGLSDGANLFSYLTNVETLDLYKVNTLNVTNMGNMFRNSNFVSLDLSSFDTSKVTNMGGMFFAMSLLEELDVSTWDTSSVTAMSDMFAWSPKLVSLDLSNFDTSSVTNMIKTFQGCSGLRFLNLSGWDVSKVSKMSQMFETCSSLISLDLSSFNPTSLYSCDKMFNGCTNLISLDLSNFDTSNVVYMYNMFQNCSSLKTLDLSSFKLVKVESLSNLFNGCSSLESLDLSNFDTSKITNMANMFQGCSSLKSVILNTWNTSNVTDMSWMFDSCSSLESLDLSNFDTSKVSNIRNMFYGCSSLESLNLSNFDTSSVTNMTFMFRYCSKLKTVVLNAWNTSNVTSMYFMFDGCRALTSLDLSGWNTINVTMEGMFRDCVSLTTLDIRLADFSQVTGFSQVFGNIPTTINITIDSAQEEWFITNYPTYTNLTLITSS